MPLYNWIITMINALYNHLIDSNAKQKNNVNSYVITGNNIVSKSRNYYELNYYLIILF
jgi:hypothetical protein